jgi:hypothetical protein
MIKEAPKKSFLGAFLYVCRSHFIADRGAFHMTVAEKYNTRALLECANLLVGLFIINTIFCFQSSNFI